MDIVDNVGADENETAKVSAVHAANGDWWTVELIIGQFLVKEQ